MATTKKAAPVTKSEAATPSDFVHMGERVTTGGRLCDKIQRIENGKFVGEPMLYPSPRRRRVIGGIYTGVRFTGTSALGFGDAKYTGKMYADATAILTWESLAAESRVEHRGRLEEVKNVKSGELDRLTLPLRREYTAMRQRGDWVGAEAFLGAVAIAIRRGLAVGES